MLKDEAIAQALDFVRNHYPVIPPLVMVQHLIRRRLQHREQLEVENWIQLPGETELHHAVSVHDLADFPTLDLSPVVGKWIVAFRTLEDQRNAGMPENLVLTVDDLDSTVRPMGHHEHRLSPNQR